ncbi:alpha/beta fold hydrolase [Streptomyces rubiginosohelvolus]|uniref:alpha/beta fold hydrolase n=1 Tax=Streptomyces rubiginosohelvolus TaxID=67362 RepID=UPI003689B53C
MPEPAGRLAAVLDELALRPVTAVGHSSGRYVATALTEQRPDLVGSLALINSGPRPTCSFCGPLSSGH